MIAERKYTHWHIVEPMIL